MAALSQRSCKSSNVFVDVVWLRPGERRHESYTHGIHGRAARELELEHHLVLADPHGAAERFEHRSGRVVVRQVQDGDRAEGAKRPQ